MFRKARKDTKILGVGWKSWKLEKATNLVPELQSSNIHTVETNSNSISNQVIQHTAPFFALQSIFVLITTLR